MSPPKFHLPSYISLKSDEGREKLDGKIKLIKTMDKDIQKQSPEEQTSEETGARTEEVSEASKKAEDKKLMGILSYISVLCLVPLLTKKDDPFIFFHAKQGLVLFIIEIINSIIATIPVIGWVIAPIIWVVLVVLSIIGIINVLEGKTKQLPVIGKLADSIKL